jgi:hypothetical protein
MKRRYWMRNKAATRLLAVVLAAMAIPLAAQSSPAPHPFSYDIRNEVTINGTVSSVLPKSAPGLVSGSHLLVATASGNLDVSLGRFGLHGKGVPQIVAGQQIEVTGVMKTIKGQQVFLARTVKVSGETYTIRNEHGIEISPQARPGVQKAEAKGNSL